MKSLRLFLPLILLASIAFCEDKPATPQAVAQQAPPALTEFEQLSLTNASLNAEISTIRQQLANTIRELVFTRACLRNNIPVDHCISRQDGTLLNDAQLASAPTAPSPAPPAEPAKPPAK